jgi:S1-C subfamily serine protease
MKVLFHLRGPAGLPPVFEHGGPLIRIGRDPQSELSLTGNAAESVSWRHARIEVSGDGAYVSDLGSTNGTYLNARRLSERTALKVGDRIQLGQTGPLLEVAVLDLKENFPPPPMPLKPRLAQERRDASSAERAGNSFLKQLSSRPADETPLPPPSPPAPPPAPGVTAPPASAPRRITGATLFVGLVNTMQRRQRRVFLVTGAVVLVLTSLVGYLLWRPVPPPPQQTPTPLSGTEIFNRVVRSTAWIVVAGKVSMGTGALIDKEKGRLLTAYHVVLGHENQEIFVFFPAFYDGKLIEKREHYTSWNYPYQDFIHVKRIVKKSPEHDLALLELERVPEGVSALPLAEESPRPGEQVHTIGNPAASQLWKYTWGVVGQVTEIEDPPYNNQRIKAWMIVTQAPINPGDSGGPLVNDACELVGVNSSGLTDVQQVNRCIDIREVKALLAAP